MTFIFNFSYRRSIPYFPSIQRFAHSCSGSRISTISTEFQIQKIRNHFGDRSIANFPLINRPIDAYSANENRVARCGSSICIKKYDNFFPTILFSLLDFSYEQPIPQIFHRPIVPLISILLIKILLQSQKRETVNPSF